MSTPSADDQHRFTLTYNETYAKVLAYLRRRSDADTAADLAAEVFVRAWRSREALWDAKHELAWLYGVARNVLLEFYRQRDHDQQGISALEGGASTQRTGGLPQVEHAAPDVTASVDSALDISRALTSLTRSDQELLTLHAWEGLDAPQIAEVLGIAPGTARVRLHRARSRLADALAGTPQTHYGSKATR